MGLEIGPIRPDEHEAAYQLRVRTFTGEQEGTYDPDALYIPDDRRVVARLDGRLVGQLGVWPFGQVFGGREVPMGGVAGVTITPDQRGRGVASRLLAAGVAIMRDAGDVVSSLYPATVAPYRAWGWALAGSHDVRRLDTRVLTTVPAPRDDVHTRPAVEADLPACRDLARRVARQEPGGLVAPDRWYQRRLAAGDPAIDGDGLDVAIRDGEVVGFASWDREDRGGLGWHLDVGLVMGADADAERALWRQLGSWWTVAPTTGVVSWPTDPLVADLPELDTTIGMQEYWMTRLVDVAGAVAARGFPDGLQVTMPLQIHDRRLPANDGPFVLEVAGGTGALTPGGDGRVAVDVHDLAAMYTGFTPAAMLARRGGLAGATPEDVAALGWAFAGPTPWMREYF